MATVLVTGGAGYIGSAAVDRLIAQGNHVIVIDNMSRGLRRLINPEAEFHEIDLADGNAIERIVEGKDIDAIMHFAAYKAVDESMADAVLYSANITGTINLLNIMVDMGIDNIIFSSSAAVYGDNDNLPISEDSNTNCQSFYAYTKAECENLIRWYSQIHGIHYTNFRYFNVLGDGGNRFTDPDAKNALPLMIDAILGKRKEFVIFGNDYPTKDGTGLRDYIDINDLIDAHILALDNITDKTINLGSGTGYTVLELIEALEEISGKKLNCRIAERREGDIASSVASISRAEELLSWRPKRNLKEMVRTTYEAYSTDEVKR